jgi:hypothetical protein
VTVAVGGMLPVGREAEAAKSAEMRSTLVIGKRRTFRTNETTDSWHFASPEPAITLSK